MRKFILLAGAALLLAAAGFAVDHARTPLPQHKTAMVSPVPVVLAAVKAGPVPIILDGIGTVQALNVATVRSQVSGMLQSIDFIEGQRVKAGQKLAQIDPRPQQATLDQARANLARDQAHLGNAKTNLGRDLPLLRRGYATGQQVAGQQSQVTQVENDIKFDQAAVENAETQLSYTSLVAPFDGVTGVRRLDIGNIIHPADASGLVTVTQVEPISVLFSLPTLDIEAVQQALGSGPVQATAYNQAGNRKLGAGKLLLINNQADPSTGTVELKAIFPNPKQLLWPGVSVTVELTVRTVRNGLTVPNDAVQQGASGPFVFVVGPNDTVATTQVAVAQREHGTALVGHGLRAGETVVEQGQYGLVDGSTIVAAKPDQVTSASPATSGLLP